ncbi:MAG: bifunctional DNA-formamidopyrimidine glycosylase/DNA-(apurinic or apyrimidinic site) lyase [Alphaproteobacteria bacterium]
MPELPEVETVKRGLEEFIINESIKEVYLSKFSLRFPWPKDFVSKIVGKKIISIKRRAKYIIIGLSDNYSIIAHLGMSGSYKVLKKGEVQDYLILKHDHLIIDLDNFKIVYNDPRRFGYIDLTNQDPETHKFLSSLGPEPLSNYFNADNLAENLLNKNKPIKNTLLDQNIVSGLGNIYVCEALFRSKINPQKNCSKLVTSKGKPRKNLILLVKKINEVIKEAIEAGGSSLRDFSNTSGKMGYFQSSFNVYNRENEKCLLGSCDGVVKRIIQSGRSTFFCSKCQR